MDATNIQQKPFPAIILAKFFVLLNNMQEVRPNEADFLFYIFRPYSGRAKSSSSLLALTNIKNYFDFFAILYPIMAMRMDMRGEMRLKRQYGR